MENFIKVSELKEGDRLIVKCPYTKYTDYEVYQTKGDRVEVICPSGAMRWMDEDEVNKDFKSVWGAK